MFRSFHRLRCAALSSAAPLIGLTPVSCPIADAGQTAQRAEAARAKGIYPAYPSGSGKTAIHELAGGYIAEVRDGQ